MFYRTGAAALLVCILASFVLGQAASAPSKTPTTLDASVTLGEVLFMRGGLAESLEYSPDGNMILAAGRDAMGSGRTSIRLWDAHTGREIRLLGRGMANAQGAAQFAGDRIVGLAADNAITFWDANGTVLDRIESTGWQFACSGDGRLLAWPAADKGIQIYDVREHKAVRTVGQGQGTAPRLSRDGSKVLAVVTGNTPGVSVTVWDTATGKQLWTAPFEKSMQHVIKADLSPDGKRVGLDVISDAHAMGNKPTEIHVYDIVAGTELFNVEGHQVFPMAVRFSPDGSTLAVCGHIDLMLLDANTGKSLPTGPQHAMSTGAMAFSPDGKTLALALHQSGIVLCDLEGRSTLKMAPGLLAMAWAKDDQSLVTIDSQGAVTRWPAAGGKPISRFATTLPAAAALASGGRIAALGTAEGPIAIYDTAAQKQIARVSTTEPASSLAVSPEGNRVVRATYDGLYLWDAATDAEHRLTVGNGEDHNRWGMMSSVFSDDLSTFACTAMVVTMAPGAAARMGMDEYEARAVDLATGAAHALTKVKRGGGRSLQSVGLSSGGELVAVSLKKGMVNVPQGAGMAVVDNGALVMAIELATDTNLPALDSPGIHVDCNPLAFSRDGRSLAGACGDDGIALWDLASGKEYARLAAPRSRVFAMAFSRDGARLAAAGQDGTVSIWALPAPPALELSKEDPWKRLAVTEAAKAYPASCELVAAGDKTVTMLKDLLKPAAAITGDIPKRVRQLVADLDSDDFETRDKANNELQSLGESAEPTLKEILKSTASDEAKSRIEKMLATLSKGTAAAGDMVRTLRAVAVLQHIGTPAAAELLAKLAAGDPASRITAAARSALQQITK